MGRGKAVAKEPEPAGIRSDAALYRVRNARGGALRPRDFASTRDLSGIRNLYRASTILYDTGANALQLYIRVP